MANVGIIIQARTTSKRLPEKVLMDIDDGVPLLEFMIKRLEDVSNTTNLMVATTTDKEDDTIVDLCERLSIPYYRGSRMNVLGRYIECAFEFNIDIIVRVCADCPFIDPTGINELIDVYKRNSMADLVHNKHNNGYPFGTGAELVTLNALKIADKNADKKHQREHVIPYILENPNKFSIIKVNAPEYLKRPDYYLTVDFPEDLKLIREIISRIEGGKKEKTPLREIIRVIDENITITNINSSLHDGFKG